MNKLKKFKLKAEEIKDLARGMGGCFATDRITVDGSRINFMYKDKPCNDIDSGWRFFAGDEDADYIDDLNNTSVFDVNTIVNYDPSIIPFLNVPIGTALERDRKSEKWEVLLDYQIPGL